MNKKRFSALTKKYLAGKATNEEKQYLEAYYEELQTGKSIESVLTDKQIADLETEMFNHIKTRVNEPAVRKLQPYQRYRTYAAIAASLLILISATLFIRNQSANADINVTTYAKADNVLKLKLSDGTIVWLNSKSNLTYPNDFNHKKLRELKLKSKD